MFIICLNEEENKKVVSLMWYFCDTEYAGHLKFTLYAFFYFINFQNYNKTINSGISIDLHY